MSETTKTVGDLSEKSQTKLPSDLRHENVFLHRQTGEQTDWGGRETYQIVFDQDYMPFDYRVGDGWRIIYSRVEYHKTADSIFWKIVEFFDNGRPCIVIVVTRDRGASE